MTGSNHLSSSLAAVLLLVLLTPCAGARETKSLGIYNSPRGFGLSLCTPVGGDKNEFNSFCLTADMYGVLAGRTPAPGIKFDYSRNRIVRRHSNFFFYYGMGATTGYLKDFEKGFYEAEKTPLKENHGLLLCASVSSGMRFHFRECLVIDLRLQLEGGFHIRGDNSNGNIHLNLYKNGIFRLPFPILGIEWRF